MTALAVLFAALAPVPLAAPQALISIQDYPEFALDRGEEGSVATQLVVDPKGRVDSCKVIISSGFADLDTATCRLLTSRARFSPARAEDGRPIYGLYRSLINWSVDRNKRAALGPDAELTLNQAPPGTSLPADVWVSYIVEPSGAISNCKADSGAPAAPQQLVSLACQQLSRAPAEVIRNSSGQAVEASDTVKVRFNTNR